jgi:hypothetical protein
MPLRVLLVNTHCCLVTRWGPDQQAALPAARGGKGWRIYPLIKLRAKPAVPIGAKYRLTDIPISNCLNSGVKTVYVLRLRLHPGRDRKRGRHGLVPGHHRRGAAPRLPQARAPTRHEPSVWRCRKR